MSDIDFRYFPYLISDIVSDVRSEYDPANGLKPAFEFGTYLELLKRLSIKDRNISAGKVDVKYPLIWLIWGDGENKETWIEECMYEISPKLFICDLTNNNASTSTKYTSPITDILYPILELFTTKLKCHKNVSIDESKFRTDRTVHPYWLNQNEGVTFDPLSAIELKLNNLLMLK